MVYTSVCIYDTVYASECTHDTFRCASAYLLQLLLLTVAILLNNTVKLLGLQARHVSLGGHPSSLLGGPGLSQVPVGGCHALTSCLLLLPPFTLVSFGVPAAHPTTYLVYPTRSSIMLSGVPMSHDGLAIQPFLQYTYSQSNPLLGKHTYMQFIRLSDVSTGSSFICLV